MKRLVRMLVGVGAALFFMIFSIPGTAVADPCPEMEIARIVCPNRPGYYIFVCQDHHGIITAHMHCFPPEG